MKYPYQLPVWPLCRLVEHQQLRELQLLQQEEALQGRDPRRGRRQEESQATCLGPLERKQNKRDPYKLWKRARLCIYQRTLKKISIMTGLLVS